MSADPSRGHEGRPGGTPVLDRLADVGLGYLSPASRSPRADLAAARSTLTGQHLVAYVGA